MIWLALGLLALNAFFVGAEFGLMSVRRSQIEPLAAAGSRAGRLVLYALEHMPSMLACLQLGVTVASTGLGAVAEAAVARHLVGPFAHWGLGVAAAHGVAGAVALVLVVYLHVVLGEMVPKNLALTSPQRTVLALGPVLVVLAWLLTPVTWALRWCAYGLLRLFRVTPRSEVTSAFTADQVAAIVEHSAAKGTLADNQGLIRETLEFSGITAAEVMVADAELVTVPPNVTPRQLELQVGRTGFSRFPVVPENGREPMGYLHVLDVLDLDRPGRRDQPVGASRFRALPQLEATDEVEDALAVMQLTRSHMVRVPGGVVFLEDLIEELVGEITDQSHRLSRPH
ncbi:MAG: CNNM domain-containing protein [Micrococcales bacterium]|nr:CNNM domain-containing protein [Micrococcales bacterium]